MNSKKLKKMKVRTQYNYDGSPGEFNRLPSKTVLDMSMSVQQILQRFVIEKQMPEEVAEYPQEYDYENDHNISDDLVFNEDQFPEEYGDIAEVYVAHEIDQMNSKAKRASTKAKQSDSVSGSEASDGIAPPAGDPLSSKTAIDES